jgi:hypothetical protein
VGGGNSWAVFRFVGVYYSGDTPLYQQKKK